MTGVCLGNSNIHQLKQMDIDGVKFDTMNRVSTFVCVFLAQYYGGYLPPAIDSLKSNPTWVVWKPGFAAPTLNVPSYLTKNDAVNL